MGRLTTEEKKGLLTDARSRKRRQDFERLEGFRYKGFSIALLEEISDLIKTDYSRKRLKAEKKPIVK